MRQLIQYNDYIDLGGRRVYAENEHELKQGNFYISCTEILNHIVPQKRIDWHKKNSANKQAKILQESATFGTTLHKFIEQDLLDKNPNPVGSEVESAYFTKWLPLKQKLQIRSTYVEKQVYSDILMIAGTADIIGNYINPETGADTFAVMDIKSGRYSVTAGWQMAFYRYAGIEMGLWNPVTGIIGLSVPRDPTRPENHFIYQHIDSCERAYLSSWQTFRMLYWNELAKAGWKGLKTNYDITIHVVH